MKRFSILGFTILAIVVRPASLKALESEPLSRPGIQRVQLVTEVSGVVPGEPFTVGLRLDPAPEHHTYWRGPGIVGVATRLDWNLPAGFSAGKILWPPPTPILMAGIGANGFKGPALLLTTITPPATIAEKKVVLKVRASWMACSVSCNPGLADLTLALPVAAPGESPPRDEEIAAAFAAAREASPKPAPDSWRFTPRLVATDRIELDAVIPGFDVTLAPSLHFFCDDMQIDSDEPQKIEVIDATSGKLRLTFVRPEFAPKSPKVFSGVLQCPPAWPGIGSAYVEISTPWAQGTFPE